MWIWTAPNVKIKNEVDYVLIDVLPVLQDIFVAPSSNTGSNHAAEKFVRVSAKRPTEINEREILRQVEPTDWVMTEDIEEDCKYFSCEAS